MAILAPVGFRKVWCCQDNRTVPLFRCRFVMVFRARAVVNKQLSKMQNTETDNHMIHSYVTIRDWVGRVGLRHRILETLPLGRKSTGGGFESPPPSS